MTKINNSTGFNLLDKINFDAAEKKGPNIKMVVKEKVNAVITSQNGVKKRLESTA